MAKVCQIASVLYEVLKMVVPQNMIAPQVCIFCFCSWLTILKAIFGVKGTENNVLQNFHCRHK